MNGLYVGTSGWSYPSWRPGFYPAEAQPADFLRFYSSRLDAVELNATKYRLPSEEQFRSWASQVPSGFRFAVKAPEGVERRLGTFEERVRAWTAGWVASASSSSGPVTTAFWSFSWARPTPASGTPSIYAIRAGTMSRIGWPSRERCGSAIPRAARAGHICATASSATRLRSSTGSPRTSALS